MVRTKQYIINYLLGFYSRFRVFHDRKMFKVQAVNTKLIINKRKLQGASIKTLYFYGYLSMVEMNCVVARAKTQTEAISQ